MSGPFELPPLPYSQDSLALVMSPEAVNVHYEQHHRAYVEKLNELVKGRAYAEMSLEKIIIETAHKETERAVFNNASQAWNHAFFWDCLHPKGPHRPTGDLERAMEESFGSYEDFREQFKEAAVGQFSNGYIWLCSDRLGKVQLVKSANAQNPLTMDLHPLLTVDVWEHAYYLDFQNRRADFVEAIVDGLFNWEFAEKNYEDC